MPPDTDAVPPTWAGFSSSCPRSPRPGAGQAAAGPPAPAPRTITSAIGRQCILLYTNMSVQRLRRSRGEQGSLGASAYRRLQAAIRDGDIVPGTRLREEELAG